MTLTDLASIATVISSIAVLASLLYLSLQIRQNTLTHRAAALEGRRAVGREQLLLALNPATAAIILRGHTGDKSMTEVERYQYLAYVTAFFVGLDEAFWLHEQGVLDEHTFHSQSLVLDGYLAQRGGRTVWHNWKPRASPAFRTFVEGRIAGLSATAATFDERWKKAAAIAERELSTSPAPAAVPPPA